MMVNAETEKILTWLRRELKQNDGQALVTLTHQNVGGFGAPLGRWPIDESDADEVLVQIAQDLYKTACDDADGQSAPGPQQYIGHFFGEADLRTPLSRLPFLVIAARQAALGPPGEGFSTEPPTEKGFIGHVMRHSDTAWRHAWTVTGHALGMIERHASQVSQENQYLRQSNFELARGYEGLLSERHIRELAAQSAIHERHERSQFWNRMWLLAPPVIGKLMGGANGPRALPPMTPPPSGSPYGAGSPPTAPQASPVPAPPSALPSAPSSAPEPSVASAPVVTDSMLGVQLRALFDSFTTEQLATLQGTLSTEQFVALGILYQSLPQPPEPPAPPAATPSPPAPERTS
jgi:hypothetical protein